MKNYRVIQWGTGFTGGYSLRYILGNPRLDLVGVKCYSDEKEGKHAGALCGLGREGAKATRDTASLLALDADCVVFMPRDYLADPSVPGGPSEGWLQDMLALLESGKNIVTSICTGTHWGHLADGAAFKERLDAACRKGNSTVHFTGFDPGFTTDALAYALSAVSGEIEQIRTWEILDYSSYTGVETLKQLGFGALPQDLSADGLAAIPTGWGGGIHLLAEAMGVAIDELKLAPDIYLSPNTFTAPGGMVVGKGTIGAIRWSLSGIVGGKPRFVVNHVNRMGNDMAPDWPQVGSDGGYRVEMDAFPPLHAEFPMGLPGGTGSSFSDAMAMTAARCVNSIEAVIQAKPGYRTFLDLAPVGARYALAE